VPVVVVGVDSDSFEQMCLVPLVRGCFAESDVCWVKGSNVWVVGGWSVVVETF
jgi:hypothetical protein